MDAGKMNAGRAGRVLWLAVGSFLCMLGLLALLVLKAPAERLTGALVLGCGTVVLLLGFLLEKMTVFALMLRHVQYLTQASEYTSRLLREITEVMRSIQAAEAEEQKGKGKNPGKKPTRAPDAEDIEFEKTLRQFEE